MENRSAKKTLKTFHQYEINRGLMKMNFVEKKTVIKFKTMKLNGLNF